MLEAVSFKKDDIVSVWFLLGGANQTSIGSKGVGWCVKYLMTLIERQGQRRMWVGGMKDRERERKRERERERERERD